MEDNRKEEEKKVSKNSPLNYLIVIGPIFLIALLCFIEMKK